MVLFMGENFILLLHFEDFFYYSWNISAYFNIFLNLTELLCQLIPFCDSPTNTLIDIALIYPKLIRYGVRSILGLRNPYNIAH